MIRDRLHMLCPFELACSGTDSMVTSLYVAVGMNRISSIPLDSMLLRIILHLDCGHSVFSRIKIYINSLCLFLVKQRGKQHMSDTQCNAWSFQLLRS